MKQNQEMKTRSLYMPESVWKSVDETAEKEDLSANQVIRRIMNLWLTGFLVEKKEKSIAPSRRARARNNAPGRMKLNRAQELH